MPLVSQIVFNKYDRDGSGTIDASELTEIAYDMGHPMSKEQVEQGLKTIDLDGSGKLTYNEFKQWWANKDRFEHFGQDDQQDSAHQWTEWVANTVKHFEYFDKDRNGSINAAEFRDLYENLVQAGYRLGTFQEAMRELDANGDGAISLKEYITWLRRYHS